MSTTFDLIAPARRSTPVPNGRKVTRGAHGPHGTNEDVRRMARHNKHQTIADSALARMMRQRPGTTR